MSTVGQEPREIIWKFACCMANMEDDDAVRRSHEVKPIGVLGRRENTDRRMRRSYAQLNLRPKRGCATQQIDTHLFGARSVGILQKISDNFVEVIGRSGVENYFGHVSINFRVR
jgi:hypothetical protein